MKLTTNAKALSAAVSQASALVRARPQLVILGNVLLEAQPEVLTVTASDGEMRLELQVPCKASEPGAITLPAQRFANGLGRMDGEITLTVVNGTKASVQAERMQLDLNGLDAKEFPKREEHLGEITFKVAAAGFLKWLGKLATTMAPPTVGRPNLECVGMIAADDSPIQLMAGNGKVLSVITTDVQSTWPIHVSIPANAVNKLRSLPDDGLLTIHVYESAIKIEAETWTLTSRLLEMPFPNVAPLIPPDDVLKREIRFERAEAASAIAFAGVAGDDNNRLLISATDDVVTFGMTGAEIGSSVALLKRKDGGAPLQLALNSRYLKDAIGCCEEPEIALRIMDANHPFIIREGNFLSVISPMRIGLQ